MEWRNLSCVSGDPGHTKEHAAIFLFLAPEITCFVGCFFFFFFFYIGYSDHVCFKGNRGAWWYCWGRGQFSFVSIGVSQDWNSDLGLAFLTSYGGWKCDQKWIYISWFLLGHVCSPNSLVVLGEKSGKLDLRGGNLMMDWVILVKDHLCSASQRRLLLMFCFSA